MPISLSFITSLLAEMLRPECSSKIAVQVVQSPGREQTGLMREFLATSNESNTALFGPDFPGCRVQFNDHQRWIVLLFHFGVYMAGLSV